MASPNLPVFLSTLASLVKKQAIFLKPSDKPLSWAEVIQKVVKVSSNQESDLIWAISSKTKFVNSEEEKERILADLKDRAVLRSHHTAQHSFGHSVC
jgi:hypothetical protein